MIETSLPHSLILTTWMCYLILVHKVWTKVLIDDFFCTCCGPSPPSLHLLHACDWWMPHTCTPLSYCPMGTHTWTGWPSVKEVINRMFIVSNPVFCFDKCDSVYTMICVHHQNESYWWKSHHTQWLDLHNPYETIQFSKYYSMIHVWGHCKICYTRPGVC